MIFEHGDGERAVELLTNIGAQGFHHWKENGATTFHEYWDSNRSRSHNHPMFGAPVGYFFEYLLGIKQTDGTAGYSSVTVAPRAVSQFQWMSGSMRTPNGVISVSYEKKDSRICFRIEIPERTKASFRFEEDERTLESGLNVFDIEYNR